MSAHPSKFGDLTIGECLQRLEQRRAQQFVCAVAAVTGVESIAQDRLVDDMVLDALSHPQPGSEGRIGSLGDGAEGFDVELLEPERWDGHS